MREGAGHRHARLSPGQAVPTILDDMPCAALPPGKTCSVILRERLDEGVLLFTVVLACPPDRLRASFQTVVAVTDGHGFEGDEWLFRFLLIIFHEPYWNIEEGL